MDVGLFDVFSIGIGPSSSHTVGPMRAAANLVADLGSGPDGTGLNDLVRLRIELLGSLGSTGVGHGTDRAVLAALEGARPETVMPEELDAIYSEISSTGSLTLRYGSHERVLGFDLDHDLILKPSERLPFHPNALRFVLHYHDGHSCSRVYYSTGGGFVVADTDIGVDSAPEPRTLPHPFRTGAELLSQCGDHGLSIAEISVRNEVARGRALPDVLKGIGDLWAVMSEAIEIGSRTEGFLPGPLKVRRRAPTMMRTLKHRSNSDPMVLLDWVSLWALAVNEHNAAGGRVVTAPTNGAAGIVPSVLKYAMEFLPGSDDHTITDFLLTASAIGTIYHATASVSGAEVGCQGEIGVASSMAAAGLSQVLGGTPEQVVNAAEIGMEHHLGLTCDPVAGLVQIPCIERNAIGATTAITAARLALAGDGRQIVSLDDVIATMMATGRDMAAKYKETSLGGLALSIVDC